MIKRSVVPCASLLLAMSLAGCQSEEADTGEAAPDAAVVATPATQPSMPSPALEDTSAPVATQPAVLTVGRTPEHDSFVADAAGRALYMFTADQPGTSNCFDACARMWPPFISPTGTPRAGAAGVQPNLIGTIERRDGSRQVTYGGHPLYYYQRDQGPGRAQGQDVHESGGEWYLVTMGGTKLEHE